MPMQMNFHDLLWSIGPAVIGALVGWIVDRWFLGRFRALARRTGTRLDDVATSALRGILPLWGALLGLRIAMRSYELPDAVEAFAPRGIFILGVFSLCLVVTRLVSGWLEQATGRMTSGEARSASILGIIVRVVVFLIGILVVLHDLGISITPMLTALGVGGLAVALALQDMLSNLFAGLQLLASRQLRVGDFVKLSSGEEGYLLDITWRNTTIKALSNHLVVVPNAKVASSIIINYHQPQTEEAVVMQVGVSYESDLERVEKVTIETAREVMERVQPGLYGFEPFVRFHTFAESSIGFSVILRVKEFTERYLVMHEFVKALHKRYREEGIVIPYPMRTINLNMHPSLIHEH
jgi:small-conductance mechanosensitive channel